MARFIKGQAKHPLSGRRKGSENKKKLAKVSEILAERDLNPAEEILKIIASGALEKRDELRAWQDLQSYCEARPKFSDEEMGESDGSDELREVSTADLLSFVKSANEEK